MSFKLVQIITNGALTLSGAFPIVIGTDKSVNLNLSTSLDLTALTKLQKNKNSIKINHE